MKIENLSNKLRNYDYSETNKQIKKHTSSTQCDDSPNRRDFWRNRERKKREERREHEKYVQMKNRKKIGKKQENKKRYGEREKGMTPITSYRNTILIQFNSIHCNMFLLF